MLFCFVLFCCCFGGGGVIGFSDVFVVGVRWGGEGGGEGRKRLPNFLFVLFCAALLCVDFSVLRCFCGGGGGVLLFVALVLLGFFEGLVVCVVRGGGSSCCFVLAAVPTDA